MVYIIYGEDTSAAYTRISALVGKNTGSQITRLGKETTLERLYQELFGEDLLHSSKSIIAENLLSNLKPEVLSRVQKDDTVIFWEQKTITPAQIKKFSGKAQIEEFKAKTFIFLFLDSIAPRSMVALSYLMKLDGEEALSWHLTNRILTLLLIKSAVSPNLVAKAIGRPVAPWQWERYTNQAKSFTKETLLSLYNGLLKIDYLIKTGATGIGQKDLISVLLFKYLRV